MEPDSSRQQIIDMPEREEMASTTSSEPQLQSPQRSPKKLFLRPRSSKPDKVSHPPPWEEDLQPEDHPCSPTKKILNLEFHKFQNNDFIENVPFQNITKDKSLNLHPIVNPEKVTFSTQSVKDSFEKQTNISDQTELFTKMKSHLTLDKESSIDIMPHDELMKSVLAYYLDKHKEKEKEKQHAYAVAYLKNGYWIIFPAVYPDHSKRGGHSGSVPTKKHSEEKLIKQIVDFLKKNGTQVIKLLVFSYNSPCLRRKNKTTCCMFLLLQKAAQWHNMYGFFTEVAFTKPWGLTGPNFFKHLTYSEISDPGSVFFSYIEKCKNTPYKVNQKKLNEVRNSLRKLSPTKSTFHKLNQPKASCHNKKDHLERGITIIKSEFPPEVREENITLLNQSITQWEDFINDESMSPIREKITTDFNNAVVQFFGKELKFFWEDSSPLRLYQVSQNMEGEGEYSQQIRELLNQPSLPHSKRVPVSIPGVGALLCGVCMSSPCQCEFSPGTTASSHSPDMQVNWRL